MAIVLPHKKVLVLASICASIILIVFSFQLSKERKAVAARTAFNSGQIVAGESVENTIADKRILEALQSAQLEALKATSTNPFAPVPTDTLSERLSKDVFSTFMRYSTDDSIDLDAVSQDAINNINTSDLPKYRYTMADINIFVAKDTNDVKRYGDQFANQYITGLKPVGENPSRYAVLSNLVPIYADTARRILSVPVPDKVATIHLQLANTFQLLSELLPIVESQQKDPLKSLLALSMVQQTMEQQVSLFTDMKLFLNQNGIIYSSEEMGRIWNGGTPNQQQ